MRSKDAFAFGLLFFLSGATGLVYELLWVRVLYQAFGSTIQSVTTVVAAYMGGLGLGAWLLGRYGDRHPRPAALYGWLEIAIGAFGVVSPLVLALAHRLYVGAAGALSLGGGASVALRFGLAALVLLIPTTLMGGTLPVLTRAFMGVDRARLQASLARLYGLNTLGAVVGTTVAGFVLIEHVGVRASVWVTAATNFALGGAALVLARLMPLAPPARPPAPPAPPAPAPQMAAGAVAPHRLRTTALVLLAVTASAALLSEIAWTRVLVLIVGGSTYAFTLILLVFLLGIGIGSALVARRGAALPPAETAASAAIAQGVTAAGAALLFVFLGVLTVYIVAVFQVPFLTATTRLALLGVAIGAVVLVPAVGMGMTFPLLTELVARPDRAHGADVGRAYALNTLGSIAGAVLTGFLLVVWLGTDVTLRLGIVISAGAALLLAVLSAHGVAEASAEHARLRTRVLGAGALAVIALGVAFAGPRWDTRLLDSGPTIYARDPMTRAALEAFLTHRGARQLTFREGPNATVSVWESPGHRTLKVNGKVDASDNADMDTQIMLGLAPAAARSGATAALVIGYGSGVTARVLADVPGMTRVRVVEIEPAVLAVDPYFRHVNGQVLERPGVSVVVDDARSALQLHDERFDVIVSEPSNPWVAGIATLYTPEFFRIARARLADDGVFCQWIQLYQLPLPIVVGIVRNLRAVFPHLEVWFGSPHDLMVLASPRPIQYDPAWVERLIGPQGSHAELGREWLGVDRTADYFGRFLLADSGVARLLAFGGLTHSDDRPALEFVAARRFLDRVGYEDVLDTLIQLAGPTDAPSRSTGALLAKALSVRRGDARGRAYVEAIRRERPGDADWAVRAALIRLVAGDTLVAEQAFAGAIARERHPDALIMSGLIALRRGVADAPRARALLLEGLERGGDSAQARAGLAVLAARAGRWSDVAAETRRSLAAARGTFRRPIPFGLLGDALERLGQDGPPALADSVLTDVLARAAGWPRLYELRAVAALRAGRCEDAAAAFVELLEFGIRRDDGPALVRECWAARR